MARTLQNFIDGEYVDAGATDSLSLVNPVTAKEFATAPVLRCRHGQGIQARPGRSRSGAMRRPPSDRWR